MTGPPSDAGPRPIGGPEVPLDAEIATLLDRLLPEVLERFLERTVGGVVPRDGPEGRYRLLSAGAFQGRLAGDLLNHARNQRLDGALVLTEEETVRVFYFLEGRIVGADSNVLFERVGRVLGHAGLLEPEGMDAIVGLEERSGTGALAEHLAPEILAWGLEWRTIAVGCALYLMPRAHFLFVGGRPRLGHLPLLDLDPMEVAMEGMRRYDEWRHRPTEGEDGPEAALERPEARGRSLRA